MNAVGNSVLVNSMEPNSPRGTRAVVALSIDSGGEDKEVENEVLSQTNFSGASPTFNGARLSSRFSFFLYGSFFFVFMFLHDYLQESLLQTYGRREAGPFLPMLDCLGCFVGPLLVESSFFSKMLRSSIESKKQFLLLTALVYISILASTIALRTVSFPVKVVVKSCKLIPTMLVASFFLQGKKYDLRDYFFAIMVCGGLAGFTLADYHLNEKSSSTAGIFLCLLSITLDSIAPNLQDKLMNNEGFTVMEVMGNTNFYCTVISVVVFALSESPGTTIATFLYSSTSNLIATLMYGASTFCGVCFYMRLVKHSGAVGAVLVSTFRKIMTISMSFVFFPKPFSNWYVVSSIMIFGSIIARASTKRKVTSSSQKIIK